MISAEANEYHSGVAFHPPVEDLSIELYCAIISTGAASIQAVTAVATYISSLVKTQSDDHVCAVISGNVDGVHYQYSASGRNCDTTSEQKTIDAAVKKGLVFMQNEQVNDACFQLTHGGTWRGLLQLAVGKANIENQKCLHETYDIKI